MELEWNSANLKAENPVLPEEDRDVLLTDGIDVRIGWLVTGAAGRKFWVELGEDEGDGILLEVTHWMPLPQVPKV